MRLLFFNICLLASTMAVAQNHVLSLEDSKTAALQYSNAIKNAQLEIQSANADKKIAESNYYPSVNLTGLGMKGFKNFVDPIPMFLDKGINNFYFAGVSAMQPIYTGGKIKTANELATLQMEVKKIRATQSEDSVLLLTSQKYWDIVRLQEQFKTLYANEKLLDGILKQQQDLLASGLIARNDLLKVKVKRSQLLLDKSRLENGRKVALFDFCLYIGISYDSLLVAKDTLGHPATPETAYVAPEAALQQNNNYHLLEKNIQAEILQTKMTKADYLPSVALGLTAGQMGSVGNSTLNKFIPTALATVTVPVSGMLWGNGKQKMLQHQIQENIAKNNFSDGERMIRTGILKSWYDVSDAYKEIAFSEENVTAARENLKVNQDNYGSGLASITELLDAQASYQQATSDRVKSYANYEEKMAEYQFAVGQLKR